MKRRSETHPQLQMCVEVIPKPHFRRENFVFARLAIGPPLNA